MSRGDFFAVREVVFDTAPRSFVDLDAVRKAARVIEQLPSPPSIRPTSPSSPRAPSSTSWSTKVATICTVLLETSETNSPGSSALGSPRWVHARRSHTREIWADDEPQQATAPDATCGEPRRGDGPSSCVVRGTAAEPDHSAAQPVARLKALVRDPPAVARATSGVTLLSGRDHGGSEAMSGEDSSRSRERTASPSVAVCPRDLTRI